MRRIVDDERTAVADHRIALRVQGGSSDRPRAGKIVPSYRYHVIARNGGEPLTGPLTTKRETGGGYTGANDHEIASPAADSELKIVNSPVTNANRTFVPFSRMLGAF